MKMREAAYLAALVITWCVTWPCVIWYTNVVNQQETARLQIRQQGQVINAQRELAAALQRSSNLFQAAMERGK